MSSAFADLSELQDLVPSVLQALQAENLWKGIIPQDVSCSRFEIYPKPYVGLLTLTNKPAGSFSAASPPSVVVKYESNETADRGNVFWRLDERTLEVHTMLSDAGVSTKLYAFSFQKPGNSKNFNFTVESAGEPQPCSAEEGLQRELGTLAGKLHSIDIEWFDKHRAVICEAVPLMREEPANSPLWVMMRGDALGELADKTNRKTFLNQSRPFAPTDEQMKRILSLLPNPVGHHAAKTVTCHGDLWSMNIVREKDGFRLIDLEGVAVSSAVVDLFHVAEPPQVESYLGYIAEHHTDHDVHVLHLEAKIAEHVHFFILRDLCWPFCSGEFSERTVENLIAHAGRFAAFAEKLRGDVELAKIILGNKDSDWRDEMVTVMAEVLDS